MKLLFAFGLFIVGFTMSAILYGGVPRLSDALLFVVVGILLRLWAIIEKNN